MGYGLTRAVWQDPPDVGRTAMLVLLYMAEVARDRDGRTMPARVYAGGWRALAAVPLGRGLDLGATDERATMRYLAELRRAKAVERVRNVWTPETGLAAYRLLYEPARIRP